MTLQVGVTIRAFHLGIRARRLERGLTQAQLGDLTGMATNCIGKIENFRYLPTDDQRAELSAALDASPDELFPAEMLDLYEQQLPNVVTLAVSVERLAALTGREAALALPSPEDLHVEGDWHDDMRAGIGEALDQLSPRFAQVIRLRFGLDGESPMTLEAVARRLSVTKERVRQMETMALRRMRHPSFQSRLLKELHYIMKPS